MCRRRRHRPARWLGHWGIARQRPLDRFISGLARRELLAVRLPSVAQSSAGQGARLYRFLCRGDSTAVVHRPQFTSRRLSEDSCALTEALLSVTDDAPECFARVPSHFRDLVEAGNRFHVRTILARISLSGSGPRKAPMFSVRWSGLVVAGRATVTRGFEMTHFKKKADQV